MKRIFLVAVFFSVYLPVFSQIKGDRQNNTKTKILITKSETQRKDTIFHKISYAQFLSVKKEYDRNDIAFYYYSGCCSFGDVGGKIPKITEVFIAKEPNGNEHKLITGNKPGFF